MRVLIMAVFLSSCSLLKPHLEIKEVHSRDSIYTKEIVIKDTILPKVVVTDTIKISEVKYYPQYKYISRQDGDLVKMRYMLDSLGNLIIDCSRENQALTKYVTNTTATSVNKKDQQPVKVVRELWLWQKIMLWVAFLILLIYLARLFILPRL